MVVRDPRLARVIPGRLGQVTCGGEERGEGDPNHQGNPRQPRPRVRDRARQGGQPYPQRRPREGRRGLGGKVGYTERYPAGQVHESAILRRRDIVSGAHIRRYGGLQQVAHPVDSEDETPETGRRGDRHDREYPFAAPRQVEDGRDVRAARLARQLQRMASTIFGTDVEAQSLFVHLGRRDPSDIVCRVDTPDRLPCLEVRHI